MTAASRRRLRGWIGTPPEVGDELAGRIVIDDWPEHIPVSEVEVDLFERWFGDFLDELFGTKH